MSKKLTILFAPVDGVGHVNPCIGVAEALKERGHRVVFITSTSWRRKLSIYGLEEEIIVNNECDKSTNNTENWTEMIANSGLLSPISPLDKIKFMSKKGLWMPVIHMVINNESKIKAIVDRIKPDVIIIDNFVGSPSLVYSGIPWVRLTSTNPLMSLDDDERTPPPASGYPSNSDGEKCAEFRAEYNNLKKYDWLIFNKWCKDQGLPEISNYNLIPASPFLSIYAYPEELDYTDLRPLPPKWARFDSFMRAEKEYFQVPDKLLNKAGKLIYFSMGTIGSVDINIMKKLISILSHSPHRFIVSKGPLHDQYKLADNMWGERSVPQTKILPLVDLVITHGGNNTVTETFYFGKPLIVMPLFGDQYDNAQRVHEKGYGIRLDPYYITENQLLDAIETLLGNEKLYEKLNEVSKRIQSSNSTSLAAQMIEKLVK